MASNDSNQLLRFMTTATSNIQEALNRQAKAKKVNHRKYIQKRLQRGAKQTKKPKPQIHSNAITNTFVGRQPVATMPVIPSSSYWTPSTANNDYDELLRLVSLPSTMSSSCPPSLTCSRPSSCQEQCDPEIDSLLSEFGLDSPSQCSHYSDSAMVVNQRGSNWDLLGPTSVECLPFSPLSEFSDFDDSTHSSPRNPSPVCTYYPTNQSPSSYYQQHVATASCEWLPPTCGPSVAPLPPSVLPLTPSLTEILELVTP